MNIKIYPSKISGTVTAPPSKSITHRAIIIASLAKGTSILKNILLSEDIKYTIDGLRQLGVIIKQNGATLTIHGTDGKLTAPKKPIFVGNSGSTLRMLTAVASLTKEDTILTGEKRLHERPIKDLLDALKKIKTGKVKIDGSKSSQYISSLLLIAPFAKKQVTIVVDGQLRSKPYVELTIDIMKTFGVMVTPPSFRASPPEADERGNLLGISPRRFAPRNDTIKFIVEKGQAYQSQNYSIEGDYSSASYFWASAAITKSTLTVKNLNIKSRQGDAYFLDILKKMGCTVLRKKNSITVKGSKMLSGITTDMNNYPDIVQTLAVVAAFAQGTTIIQNIGHLKDKETDRIISTAHELRKMGIKVVATNDSLTIIGGQPKKAVIETYNDHRMAMSFAVAGLAANETIIKNAEVVNKSYPDFWKDLKSMRAKIEII